MSYYKADKELKELRKYYDKLPELTSVHWDILKDLEIDNPYALRNNRTKFLISEMFRYCKEQKVWRTAHTGETRGGKSEGAQFESIIFQHIFNQFLEKGHFDNVDVDIQKTTINLTENNIHRNKIDYLEHIKDEFQKKTLVYGEQNIIDEEENAPGGLGVMSAQIELDNFNNIVAKYNLGEHWLYPKGFLFYNITYGFHWLIKDVVNRVNWALLYRILPSTPGINTHIFMGWVCFPLHQNEQLRVAYEKKKNHWIDEVIRGGGDTRALLRKKASEQLAKNKMFKKMKSEHRFLLTNDQQLSIVDDLISRGEMRVFNQQERVRIVSDAQLIVKKELYPEQYTE